MLKQTLSQKMLQKLSPQQIQLMKLLQVPTMELDQRIKEEIEENPALEEGADQDESYENEDYEERGEVTEAEREFDINDYLDDDLPQYKTSVNNKGRDDEDKSMPISGGVSFQDVLLSQLGLRKLTTKERTIAETIIGNIDEDGYLRRDIESMVDDLAFSQNVMCREEEI